ncbi:MAG: hypothetical protein AMXMBFR34_35290 [Myxococcaceae bacterium]
MIRRALTLSLLFSAVVQATPSGHRWDLDVCPPVCLASEQCVSGRCLPAWRIAASIGNGGGMTLNGGVVPYGAVISRTSKPAAAA